MKIITAPYLFIYAKEGKIKCLTVDEAHEEKLTSKGWTHTTTINPARWIEFIANGKRDPSDMLDELQFSKL
jgi:threonine dehydrogenase-like Zn-dependent dehydrogenase